jgi:hypothetical protein
MAGFRSDPQRRLRAEELQALGTAERLAAELALTRARIAALSIRTRNMPEPDRRELMTLHTKARATLEQMISERTRAADLRSKIENVGS